MEPYLRNIHDEANPYPIRDPGQYATLLHNRSSASAVGQEIVTSFARRFNLHTDKQVLVTLLSCLIASSKDESPFAALTDDMMHLDAFDSALEEARELVRQLSLTSR